MEKVRRPIFTVLYEGKNVTEDISKSLISLTYTDVEEGESDEISLSLEDTDGLWRGPWYPSKGDQIALEIGYDDGMMLNCGKFTVDEIELSGPPDTVTIRALAAATNSPIRTKKSKAYEGQTFKQIAEKVAADHGYTVQGDLPNVTVGRVTQNRETDLGFLKRIGETWGLVFSIRDKTLIFTAAEKLDNGEAVAVLDRTDLISYSYRDKSISTFKAAKAAYHNPKTNETVSFAYTDDGERLEGEGALPPDTLELRLKAENPAQAEAQAKAALKKANTAEVEGSLKTIGNPLLVAGINFALTGMGKVGGTLHVTRSTHSISRSGGYTTDLDFKRVKRPTPGQQSAKPKPQPPGKFAYTT
jgi:phage protein D